MDPDAVHSKESAARHDACPAALCCPLCSTALQLREGAVACPGCRRHYPVEGGVIDLRLAAAGSAGADEPRDDLPIIEVATPAGWTDAVRGFLAGRDDGLQMLDALVAGRHQAWRGFLDLKAGSRALCLGSGYGALVESLAPYCARLFVLEPDIGQLRFVRNRLAIFNTYDDIVLLAGSAEGRLPFADGSLDAVFMAEPSVCGAPGRLLGEVRRVLREGGQLFLIADNRFSLALPAGWWDRWTAAPRPLPGLARSGALLVRWWQKRSGAQSLPQLCRQLTASGFSDVEAFGLWPARRQFDEVTPLHGGRPLALPGERLSWKQRLKRSGFLLPAHCLTIQAGGPRRRSSYDRILAAAAGELAGGRQAVPIRALRHLMTRKDKMIVQARRGDENLVIRVPFGAAAAAAEERHAAALARLAVSHPGLAPLPLSAGRIDGIAYRVETALPGVPLKLALFRHGSAEFLKRVEALLDAVNPAGSLVQAPLEGTAYGRLVEARLGRLFHLVRDPDQQSRLRSFFRRQLYGTRLPFGLVHGDFSASNIYLAGDRAGIVDWEAADFDDLPILDAIGYLESVLRPSNPRRSLAESFRALARREFPAAAEARFLFARYERFGIDPACHGGLVYLRWLRQIDYLVPYWLSYDPGGQERYIHQVVRLLPNGERAG